MKTHFDLRSFNSKSISEKYDYIDEIFLSAQNEIFSDITEYKKFLGFNSKLYKTNYFQTMDVYVQNPNAETVGTLQNWKNLNTDIWIISGSKAVRTYNRFGNRDSINNEYLYDKSQLTNVPDIKRWTFDDSKIDAFREYIQSKFLEIEYTNELSVFEVVNLISNHYLKEIQKNTPDLNLSPELYDLSISTFNYMVLSRLGLDVSNIDMNLSAARSLSNKQKTLFMFSMTAKVKDFFNDLGQKMLKIEKAQSLSPIQNVVTYSIYQVRDDIPNRRDVRFMNKKYLDELNIPVSISNYNLVYQEALSDPNSNDFDLLEELYTKFNIDRPADFKGHSMSVSDVVVLNKNGKEYAYFTDSFGFVSVPEFFIDLEMKKDIENNQDTEKTSDISIDLDNKENSLLSLQVGDYLIDQNYILWCVKSNDFNLQLEKAPECYINRIIEDRFIVNWKYNIKSTGRINKFDTYEKITVRDYVKRLSEISNFDLQEAKYHISEYFKEEFDNLSSSDFSDLSNVGLAYTTIENEELFRYLGFPELSKEFEIQVSVNLTAEKPSINTWIDNELIVTKEYDSLAALNSHLRFLDFNDLISVSDVDWNIVAQKEIDKASAISSNKVELSVGEEHIADMDISELAQKFAKSALAWDEIDSLGFAFNGWNGEQHPMFTNSFMFGHGLHGDELINLAYRFRDGFTEGTDDEFRFNRDLALGIVGNKGRAYIDGVEIDYEVVKCHMNLYQMPFYTWQKKNMKETMRKN